MRKEQRTDQQSYRGAQHCDNKRHFWPPRRDNRTIDVRCLFRSSFPQFFGNLWVTETIFVEIKHVEMQPMLHPACAEVVQMSPPVAVFRQIFRNVSRQQNVSSVAALQHPLGEIDSRARNVGLLVNVYDAIYRTTMNSHP